MNAQNQGLYWLPVLVFNFEAALVVPRPGEDGQPRHVADGGQGLASKAVG